MTSDCDICKIKIKHTAHYKDASVLYQQDAAAEVFE